VAGLRMDGVDSNHVDPPAFDLGWLDLSDLDVSLAMVDSIRKVPVDEWNRVARYDNDSSSLLAMYSVSFGFVLGLF
jgi:hypothetical protein